MRKTSRVIGHLSVGVLAATVIAGTVLAAQTLAALRKIPNAQDCIPFKLDNTFGAQGKVLRLAILGDSISVGFGADTVDDTIGAILALGLSDELGVRVRVKVFGQIGATSKDLDAQVDRALAWGSDVALILIGANDITHNLAAKTSTKHLQMAVHRFWIQQAKVFVGTCPDLSLAKWILPNPLRFVAGVKSRLLAAAQTSTTQKAGGVPIQLTELKGFFLGDRNMFSPDMFHPSSMGYAKTSEALLKAIKPHLSKETA